MCFPTPLVNKTNGKLKHVLNIVAILYVKRCWQSRIHPLVIPNAYNRGFQAEFFMPGVLDLTPVLCIPLAIRFWKSVVFNDQLHCLAYQSGKFLAQSLGGYLLAPECMIANMVTIVLPEVMKLRSGITYRDRYQTKLTLIPDVLGDAPFSTSEDKLSAPFMALALHDQLRGEYDIECVSLVINNEVAIRITAQCYNDSVRTISNECPLPFIY
jgi:hypothetical protein